MADLQLLSMDIDDADASIMARIDSYEPQQMAIEYIHEIMLGGTSARGSQ